MALIKTREQQEMELLEKVEQDIRRSQKREKYHRLAIIGLSLLTVGAFIGGAAAAMKYRYHWR